MVMIDIQGHRFFMDGYLYSNLTALKHSVVKQNYDGFIIVSGREGFGKSTLAFQMALFLDESFCLDRVVFSLEQFKHAVDNADKYQTIVFDETMGYLSSRGAMSKFNKSLVKIFSEMRSKNLFVILNITSFFELDRYPAMHRSNSMVHVYRRSFFGSYDYNTKKKLYVEGKRIYSYSVSPNFIGRFPKHFPLDVIKYEQKKQESIKLWDAMRTRDKIVLGQRNNLIREIFNNKWMTTKQIADLVGLSIVSVGEVLIKGE